MRESEVIRPGTRVRIPGKGTFICALVTDFVRIGNTMHSMHKWYVVGMSTGKLLEPELEILDCKNQIAAGDLFFRTHLRDMVVAKRKKKVVPETTPQYITGGFLTGQYISGLTLNNHTSNVFTTTMITAPYRFITRQ